MSVKYLLAVVDDEILTHSSRWLKGEMHFNGRHCLMGAVEEAVMEADTALHIEDYNATIKVLRDAIPELPDLVSITAWNDLPDTTFEDVKAVIKRAREAAA